MSNETILIGDILGAILQPIYFSLFMFYTKEIKNKRLLFITIMILETLILRCGLKIYEGINFELLYSISMYVVMKLLYENKTRITDLIIFIISVIFQGIVSVLCVLIIGTDIFSIIISSVLLIIVTYFLKHKLPAINNFFNKFWNRHTNKKVLKSVTIRGLSSVITIVTFLLMYFWLIYMIKIR